MSKAAPARFGYADPPYLGLSEAFYSEQHEQAAEYDALEAHRALIQRLQADYDGWALHLHVPSLPAILPLLPPEARLCAWVKPWVSYKPGVRLAYGWEPVVIVPVRPAIHTVPDWVSATPTRRRGLRGAKPDEVVFWICAAAGLQATDELDDLFPGTGAVGRAWRRWRGQAALFGARPRQQRPMRLGL